MIERNRIIDIAKGIGIIAVVWGHLARACPSKNEIYLFHMPLFFLLSGYFFNDSKKTLANVIKKNIQTYIIPYLTFFAICLPIFVLLYTFTGRAEQIHINLGILIKPYGVVTPLWFLIALAEVNVIYYFISCHGAGERSKWIYSLVCLGIGYLLFNTHTQLPLFIGSSFSMVLFYHIGYLMNSHSVLKYNHRKKTKIAIISVVFYTAGILLQLHPDIGNNQLGNNLFLFVFAALGGSFITIFISEYINKVTFIAKILAYLGQNSLVIFALHMLSFEIARCLFGFPALENTTDIGGIVTSTWGILCSLALGIPIKTYLLSHLKPFKKG